MLFLLGIGIASYICLYKLGSSPLENWDEAWYGEMIKQMLRTKDLLIPNWNGGPYFDKPPLYLWMGSLASLLFGLSEFSIRLPSALLGVATITLVTWYSYRKFGFVASLVAFITIAFNSVFIWRARSGNLDVTLAFVTFLVFLLMNSRWRWRYPALGFLFGCLYLTKTTIVLFPLAIFGLTELLFEWRNIPKNIPYYILGLIIGGGLTGGWLFLGKREGGIDFYNYYVGGSDQGVSKISWGNRKLDYIQYAYYSLQRRFFWVFIAGLIASIPKLFTKEFLSLVLFSTLLLLQLSFTERNNNWYLLPSMPFWSVVSAYAIRKFLDVVKERRIFTWTIVIVVLFLSYRTFVVNIVPLINTYGPVDEAKAGKLLKKLTQAKETVYRLDHLYPTLIYYSDRNVAASPDIAQTGTVFISRKDLIEKIKKKKVHWISGWVSDFEEIDDFVLKDNWKVFNVGGDERVVEILQ